MKLQPGLFDEIRLKLQLGFFPGNGFNERMPRVLGVATYHISSEPTASEAVVGSQARYFQASKDRR